MGVTAEGAGKVAAPPLWDNRKRCPQAGVVAMITAPSTKHRKMGPRKNVRRNSTFFSSGKRLDVDNPKFAAW
jgi:hypothetical protein